MKHFPNTIFVCGICFSVVRTFAGRQPVICLRLFKIPERNMNF